MNKLFIAVFLLLFIHGLKSDIIYQHPVNNSEHVSIENNIIIGFDEKIESRDINSLLLVSGSLSGNHKGSVILTSDKKKLIFKPHIPFAFNETVEVKLNRVKTVSEWNRSRTFNFKTQVSKISLDSRRSFFTGTGTSAEYRLPENPSLNTLPAFDVLTSNNPSPGDLYLGNFPFISLPDTRYVLVSDNKGNFSFSREVNVWGLDYKRQPNGLLTYSTNRKFYAENTQHNIIDSFVCGNGYVTDHHEFLLLNNGHSLMMSYDPRVVDMSQIVTGGNPNAIVIGLIIQELDENKNVVFQWRSWDHMIITDAIHEDLTAEYVDYVHGNAIELDNDGNLMISSRNLSEITKINRLTGEIIWRLGGVRNEFAFINDTNGFSYQHDIRRIDNGNITLFDNGNYHSPPFSRAVEYILDEVNKTVELVWQYRKSPDVYNFAMGSVQRLRNGNTLIGWGSGNPTLTEVTPDGNVALEMDLPKFIYSYRIFRDEVNLTLNIKLAQEGFYNSTEDKLNTADTVIAFVRNTVSPYGVIDSAVSIVDSVNFTGNYRFYNVPQGIYYISLRHRNSLETWSREGGETFESGGVYKYDFTDSDTKSYGNNVIYKGTKFCLFSGDVNQDGAVDLTDATSADNDSFYGESGYLNTDINGDYILDISDLNLIYNNLFNGVSVIKP